MNTQLPKFLLIFLLNASLYAQDATEIKIDSFLNQLHETDFSGTILVARNDTVLEKRAYGMANIEFEVKNNIDTKFHIASITKSFTSAAILQLYEKGKVELHKPIGAYLTSFPNEEIRNSVTIHHLLTHTAGTKAIYGENYQKTNKTRYREIEDYLPLFATDSLLFPPGSKYEYNGGGFVILAMIIEKVSGENYYSYLKNNIFSPLGMKNTFALEVDEVIANRADGYSRYLRDDHSLAHNDYFLSKASGASGHYSTVEDLFRYSRGLRNNILLKEETTRLMFEPKVQGFHTKLGYGIDVDLRYNQPILGHNGGWYGIRAEWMDFMKSGYTVVILSNVDNDGKDLVSDFFKNLIAEKPKPGKAKKL